MTLERNSLVPSRGTLAVLAIATTIGAVLGALAVADNSCGGALQGLRAALLGIPVLFIAFMFGFGGLLVAGVGHWRRDSAMIRSSVRPLLIGVALAGSYLIAANLTDPCR